MNTKNYQNNHVFIIPTFTNTAGLIKVLKLLNEYNQSNKVIIVNNNKKQNLNEVLPLKEIKNKIVIIDQNKNTGFAKACNDGAKKADELYDPDFFVFLNDDVLFKNDFTQSCINFMSIKKWEAGSPILIKSSGKIENVGYKVLPFGKIQLITSEKSTEKIDGLSATALVIKKATFNRLHGFDEKFFAYLEDVDLFLRAKKLNIKFGVCKNSKVIHKGQETSSKMSVKKAFLDFKNWILIISKNWSREDLVKNLPEIILERGRNLWGVVKAIVS